MEPVCEKKIAYSMDTPTKRKRKVKTESDYRASAPLAMTGKCNYFLRRRSDNVVKIGYTDEFPVRLRTHQAEAKRNGTEYEVLAVVSGTTETEKQVQNQFYQYQVYGQKEMFSPVPDLYRYIRWLRTMSFVAVYDGDFIEQQPFDAWDPSKDGRRIEPPFPLLGEFELGDRLAEGEDYYTPEHVIEAVRAGMGGIDLDPASHHVANRKLRIPAIYNRQANGLVQPWFGRVWLNPPFSEHSEWAAKAVDEVRAGRVEQLIYLMTTRTITSIQVQKLLDLASLEIVTIGRLNFWGPNSLDGSSSSTGQVMYYIGPRWADVAREFWSRGIGRCWRSTIGAP